MLIDEAYIQESASTYAVQIISVIKRDKPLWIYVNDSSLNKKTVPHSYPVSRFEDLLVNSWRFYCFLCLGIEKRLVPHSHV